MHHGMQYDLIQGQGQGHEPLKLANSVTLKGYLLPPPEIWTFKRSPFHCETGENGLTPNLGHYIA